MTGISIILLSTKHKTSMKLVFMSHVQSMNCSRWVIQGKHFDAGKAQVEFFTLKTIFTCGLNSYLGF